MSNNQQLLAQMHGLMQEVIRLRGVVQAMQQNPQVFVQAQPSKPNYAELSANALSLLLKYLNDKSLSKQPEPEHAAEYPGDAEDHDRQSADTTSVTSGGDNQVPVQLTSTPPSSP